MLSKATGIIILFIIYQTGLWYKNNYSHENEKERVQNDYNINNITLVTNSMIKEPISKIIKKKNNMLNYVLKKGSSLAFFMRRLIGSSIWNFEIN